MRICLVGQACAPPWARTTAGAARAIAVVASKRRRDSGDMSVPPFSEDSLHAAAVPRTRAELVDVDALDAAQVDADRRRAVRAGPLGIAFDAAGRAEAVVQLLLVEQ